MISPRQSKRARTADPESSWTAKLLAKGPEKCAEKFGEEAVEAIIEAVKGDQAKLTSEAGGCAVPLAGDAGRAGRRHWMMCLMNLPADRASAALRKRLRARAAEHGFRLRDWPFILTR